MTETKKSFILYENSKLRNFLSLLKLDFNLYGKRIFIAPLVVNLIFIFNILITIFIKKIFIVNPLRIDNSINLNFFLIISLFIGCIITANSYKHLHREEKATQFFMVPATIFEKFLSIWLYYFFFYLIISIFFTIIAFLINNIFIFAFLKTSYPLDAILSLFNYKTISTYFFLTSIFMLGSTYFKKNSFLLTILAILAIFFAYFIIYTSVFLIFFNGKYIHFSLNFSQILQTLGLKRINYNLIVEVIKILLSIFFYFLTYLRIVEYDVKGE